MSGYIRGYVAELQRVLDYLPVELINQVIYLLQDARMNRRRIFVMGNGGSASTASHFAADLGKNTRREGWPDFKILALTDNMAAFSAYANDEGYESVFRQQLAAFIEPGDVVIGISTSGNSRNVLKAIELANDVGATTIGLTGFDGGLLGRIVDVHLHVQSNIVEQVEDVHLVLEHMIVKALREIQVGVTHSEDGKVVTSLALPEMHVQTSLTQGTPFSASFIYQVLRELEGSMPHDEMLPRLLELSLRGIGGQSGSIVWLDAEGEVVEAALAYNGQVEKSEKQKIADTVEKGLAGWVVENQQPALVSSTRDDPRWLDRSWDYNGSLSRSAISVPLLDRDGVKGVLTVVHNHPRQFTQEHLVLLTAIGVFTSLHTDKDAHYGHEQEREEMSLSSVGLD